MRTMRVLSLSSNETARFYVQQNRILEELGVDVTTVSVPGAQFDDQADDRTRSPLDYARFVPTVFRGAYGNFDLVHANYGLTAPAAVLQPRLPVVTSLWGSDLMGRLGPVSKLAARWSDEVVVMSDRMAAELDQPCHVVPHGVDLDRFEPIPREAARREVGWEGEDRVVFFPYATNRAVKNYPLAERVAAAVDRRLEADVALKTVSGVPHERMGYYYNAADALLLTSRREGSPNSVKEAMACDLPVVATDVGDLRERLDGVTPSAVCTSEEELATRLAAVLDERRRSNGREQVRELSFERTGERLKSVFERALDRDRSTPDDESGAPEPQTTRGRPRRSVR